MIILIWNDIIPIRLVGMLMILLYGSSSTGIIVTSSFSEPLYNNYKLLLIMLFIVFVGVPLLDVLYWIFWHV